MAWLCGCVEIDSGVQPVEFTVTVATLLSTWPQEFVTRTQYVVVVVGEGLYVDDVLFGPGATGPPGGVPVYQRYVSVAVPDAETLRFACWPELMVWLCGCVLIVGAVQAACGMRHDKFEGRRAGMPPSAYTYCVPVKVAWRVPSP